MNIFATERVVSTVLTNRTNAWEWMQMKQNGLTPSWFKLVNNTHNEYTHIAAIVFPLTHNMAHQPPPRYKLWPVKWHSKSFYQADLCVIVPVSCMCQVRLFIFSHNKYFQFQSFIRWHFRCNQLTFNSHYYTWAVNEAKQRKKKQK